jgi:mannose-6-phosphate isomerase-like protein (cupin superfamily)
MMGMVSAVIEASLAMENTSPVTLVDTRLILHSKEKGWQSADLLSFNDNKVRYRTMNGVEARWHKHDHTDEMFFVLSGQLEIDIRDAAGSTTTHIVGPNQMLAVHLNCEHRARSAGLTTLLVFDAIGK